MKLSAPIYRLKRLAKSSARRAGLPLHAALNEIARKEGFQSWSHLSACHSKQSPASRLLKTLHNGDLVVLGARPNQGKTTFGLELLVEALRQNRQCHYFTLYDTESTVYKRLIEIGVDTALLDDGFALDTSDEICAGYIIGKGQQTPSGSVILVDYLQILDQKREHPPLQQQLLALKKWAISQGCIVVLLSQIDRRHENSGHAFPDLDDVYRPNPLDLSLFSKSCFLHEGEVRFHAYD